MHGFRLHRNVEMFLVSNDSNRLLSFLFLNRLPVQWENSDILVMKEVRVRSPYLSDCVFGGTDAANNRVKKVVSFTCILLCYVDQAFLCECV